MSARGMGAYYANHQDERIAEQFTGSQSGVGAYFETQMNAPINGLGADGVTDLGFAEQTLQAMLNGQIPGLPGVAAPIGLYTAWGTQEGSVDWQDIRAPEWTIALYPLTNALIATANRAAFGHEVGWAAVLTDRPTQMVQAERAFTGRRYKLFAIEGVYRQDDPAPVPRIFFLYWTQLRDDPDDVDGGPGSMDDAAKALGGRLVFPIQGPRTGREREHPAIPFTTALGGQLAQAPAMRNGTAPSSAPAAPTAPTAVAPAAGISLLFGLGVAAGATYLGYRWWKGRK